MKRESVRSESSSFCSSHLLFFYTYIFFRNKIPSVLLLRQSRVMFVITLSHILTLMTVHQKN